MCPKTADRLNRAKSGTPTSVKVPIGDRSDRDLSLRTVDPGVGSAANRGDERGTSRPAEMQARHVLLVDDNAICQQLGRALLAARGLSVTLAADGATALEALNESVFDLVLMDIQMPGMNGYEATERLRRNPRLSALPVIAMTAGATEDDRQACLAAGMDEFFAKPIEPQRLYAVIDQYLKPSCTASGEAPGSGSGTGPATAAFNDPRVIDVSRGLYFTGGQMPLYTSLLREFGRLHRSDAETLRCLVAWHRMEDARRLVHTLKGVADGLGAIDLRDRCQVIEASLPDRLNEGDVGALSHAHGRVLHAIARLPEAEAEAAAASAKDARARGSTWNELVEEMRILLKQGNLRALDCVSSCREHVGGRYDELMTDLEDLLMQFRFDDAIERLERLDAVMRVEQSGAPIE